MYSGVSAYDVKHNYSGTTFVFNAGVYGSNYSFTGATGSEILKVAGTINNLNLESGKLDVAGGTISGTVIAGDNTGIHISSGTLAVSGGDADTILAGRLTTARGCGIIFVSKSLSTKGVYHEPSLSHKIILHYQVPSVGWQAAP